jgi:hypothetical protein
MRHLGTAVLALAIAARVEPGIAIAQQRAASYNLSTHAVDWLVKSVCADTLDKATSADPYYVCPTGTHLRKIKWGEAPPYNNVNQTGNLWSDSFILSDAQGEPLFFRSFDWGPTFGLWSNNVDGYDTYALNDGWVAINATKSGDSGGQTFFGANCSRDTAWLSFPLDNFLTGGTYHSQIGGRNWEQAGKSFPGPCPMKYYPLQTDWRLQHAFPFGGKGQPKKIMDTLVSFHDFQNNQNYVSNGHMEVYYFTQQYGLTRWEFWTPAQQGTKPTPNCDVQPTVSFNGLTFVVQDCQDLANVTPGGRVGDQAWPLPQANLLADGHFSQVRPIEEDGAKGWRVSSPTSRGTPNWQLTNSTSPRDKKYDPTGIRLVVLDCRGQANCASLSQQVPASRVPSGLYLYGASVRTSPGSQGDFRIELQALSVDGKVLWHDAFSQIILSYNGSHPGNTAEAASTYQSTAFPHKIIRIPVTPDAATYQIVLTALGSARYEVTEGWFNRWPDNWTGPIGLVGK